MLAAIAPYNEYLEKSTAHSLIIALQGGLLSKYHIFLSNLNSCVDCFIS